MSSDQRRHPSDSAHRRVHGLSQTTVALPGAEAQRARLAGLFAREPELIQACLQAVDRDESPDLGTVVAAALQAVTQRPQYADLHYFAAQAAARAGQLDRARTLLGRALRLNPQYRDALILAARISVSQGQPDEAIAYLRAAQTNGADYADVHLMLGDLWRQRGEARLARQAYEHALRCNPHLSAARQGLAALPPAEQRGGTDEPPA